MSGPPTEALTFGIWERNMSGCPGEEEIDRLMQQQMITLDYEQRKRMYDRVQQFVWENLPLISLVSPNVLAGQRNGLGISIRRFSATTRSGMSKNFSFAGEGKRPATDVLPTKTSRKMDISRQDHLLVQDCLHGNQEAWSAIDRKYKNLIFSIPIKRGFSPDDAADIFQTVCLALVSELPRLREPRALPAWLIQTTSHKCFQWQDKSWRSTEITRGDTLGRIAEGTGRAFGGLQREQIVRDAVAELSTQCRRLVELLFYRMPASSYDDLAASLEIPKGSVGPTRMRCLEKLRRLLEKKGF